MAASPSQRLTCDHGLRRQMIVQSVLAEVFQGRLRAGQHLVTRQLAEQMGVSHTPIREALIVLAGIGILDLLPNRGAIVRHVTEQDVREICQVRRVMECAAVRRACGRIGLGELKTLCAELEQLASAAQVDGSAFIARAREVDSRLHDLIASSCGNRFLNAELNRLKLLFRAFRDVAWEESEARNDYHRLAEEAVEHLAIVRPLLSGDGRAASRAMSKHIQSGYRYWARALPVMKQAQPALDPQPGTVHTEGISRKGKPQ